MPAEFPLTSTMRAVGRLLLMVALASVLLLVLDRDIAGATTPPTLRAAAQTTVLDMPTLRAEQEAAMPRAAATPSPHASSSPAKSKKKSSSSSSSLILLVLVGVAAVIYLTSRNRKRTNGTRPDGRGPRGGLGAGRGGGTGGLFGGARGMQAQPRRDDPPDPPQPGIRRARPKRRGRQP